MVAARAMVLGFLRILVLGKSLRPRGQPFLGGQWAEGGGATFSESGEGLWGS